MGWEREREREREICKALTKQELKAEGPLHIHRAFSEAIDMGLTSLEDLMYKTLYSTLKFNP